MSSNEWITLLTFLQNVDEAVASDYEELENAKNSPIFDEDVWPAQL